MVPANQSVSQRPNRQASEPFDRDDADFILRSCDMVQFFVHRIILALSSPLFSTMLSLPQPPPEATVPDYATDGRPVIEVAEDSETLDLFLRLCYPMVDPPLVSFPLIRRLLATAMKYDAPSALHSAKKALVQPSLLEEDPLRSFAIACCFRLEEEAEIAAEKAVIDDRVVGKTCPEIDEIPAAAYHRLLKLNRTRKLVDSPKFPDLQCYVVDFADVSPFFQPCAGVPEGHGRTSLQAVEHPFDASDATLILRSRDLLEFRVNGALITLASPNILQLAPQIIQPAGAEGLPMHSLEEDSVVVDAILRMCYPVEHPRSLEPAVLLDVLDAAGKYQMKKVLQVIRSSWSTFIEHQPLRLFFAATQCGWHEEARMCARFLVDRHEVRWIYSQYVSVMETIANRPYRRLLLYVDECSKAASAAIKLVLDNTQSRESCSNCCARFPTALASNTRLPWNSETSLRLLFHRTLKSRPSRTTLLPTTAVAKSFLSAAVNEPIPLYCVKARCSAARNLSWALAVLESYGDTVEKAVE
ncbi:hypothetical protein NUW54_g11184 [Trametes sanguinea]|uniref:Uncharacterized protein n=1 Tax=Trametes sanguinea TaxID=158606 RepID=A0ACC1NJB3_9APHY|nr:hypothetical protein NUW54_g11184 [Trametes sanguinea]